MKKIFIVFDNIAAAEYVPKGIVEHKSIPPHINIFLKQGGAFVIDEETYGGAVFQERYDTLFVDVQ